MAYLNVKERTIEAKIVYYGAGLSGKTTNLEKIKGQSTEGRAGEMMALDTDGDRTLFFDYLPFNIGKFNGCEVKVQLYTVPGQQKYSETRKKVLAAADGVVLVLDSQSGAVDKNKEILADLREHLQSNGIDVSRVPVVVQLNKRDLPTAMPVEELASAVDLPNWPRVEAVAATGQGVFETLREATKLVLQALREGARDGGTAAIKTGAQSGLDGQSLYNTLVASGIAPATAEAPAAKADAPGATRSAPAPAAAAPKESRDGKADKSTGADKSEGKKAPAGSGATPGAAAGSSTASAVTAPAVTAAGATTQPVAPPQTPAAREAAPHPTQPSVPATTATATNELIAGQRNLLRRIEQFEHGVQHAMVQVITEMEKRLVSRVAEGVEQKLRAAAEARRAEDAQLRQSVTELRSEVKEVGAVLAQVKGDVGTLDTQVQELRKALEAHGKAAEQRASTLAPQVQKVETGVIELQKAHTALQDALQKSAQKLGSVESGITDVRAKAGERYATFEQISKEMKEELARITQAVTQKKGWFG